MPVSVRYHSAIRTVKFNLSELILFFSAAMARIYQLEDFIIVADGGSALPRASGHPDSSLTTVVLDGHIHE